MADMLGNLHTTAAVSTSRAGAEAHSRGSISPLQPLTGIFNIVNTPPIWLATTTKRPSPPDGSRGGQAGFDSQSAYFSRTEVGPLRLRPLPCLPLAEPASAGFRSLAPASAGG